MKKLKKLLSVVLAGAMALSLCATALATATPVTDFDDPADLGDTIDAEAVSEGALPPKPISIILPTVTAREDLDEGVSQLFDFILDPHNLIKETNAAAYVPATGDAPTFDPDTRLYFASEAGAEYTYSGVSKSLTVTNTGFVPLDVDLDVEFNYGSAEGAFTLVDSASNLSSELGAPAQMYLAVVSSSETKAIVDPADGALPAVKFTSNDEYLSTKPVFEYTDEYDADTHAEGLDAALAAGSITLTFTPFEAGDPDADPATDDAPANIAVAATGFGSGYVVTFADGEENDITDPLEDETEVVATIGTADAGDANAMDTALATVTFTVAKPSADKDAEAGVQTLTFNVPHTGATIETALGVLADSYKLAQTMDADTIDALDAAGVERNANGYYWNKVETDNSAYPAFSFHLEGNINEANKDNDSKVSPWDKVNAASQVKFDMTWNVSPYSAVRGRDQKTDPAGSASAKPTVEVESPATGTGTSTKYATLTWTAGMGTYEAYEPTAIKSGNAAGSNISFTKPTATTLKLTATATNKDSKCIVTFSDGENSVDVEVEGWYTGT